VSQIHLAFDGTYERYADSATRADFPSACEIAVRARVTTKLGSRERSCRRNWGRHSCTVVRMTAAEQTLREASPARVQSTVQRNSP